MTHFFTAMSVLILLITFVLVACKRPTAYIRAFRYQSVLVALTTAIMGIHNFYYAGEFDVLLVCLLTIALKVLYIPELLGKTFARVEYKVEKDFFYNIPILIIICCVLVMFTYFIISRVEGINYGPISSQMINTISAVLISLLFMSNRKKAIGQIVGFLFMENALFMTGLFATNGMPFIVDIGILIDVITAVMVMGLMVFKLNDEFASTDTKELRNLRG